MVVIKKAINIKPKNISKKKFFLIFKSKSLPYPEIDIDSVVIPNIKISI